MYAIINKRTKKYLYGTDKRTYPPRQRTSFDDAKLYEYKWFAESDMKARGCGKNYKVVEVELKVIGDA